MQLNVKLKKMNLIFSIKKYCKSLGSMCYYLLYYVILEACIRKCLYVCLLVIHFNLWIQSSDYLYVVLPLITSGKRRCAKLDFKLPRTIFQIFDLEVLFWTSLSHIWGQIISELTFLFSYTRTYTRYFSNFRTNLM